MKVDKTTKKIKRNTIGLYIRRENALKRLMHQQQIFSSIKQDKVRKNGDVVPFEKELQRINLEISTLKAALSLGVSTAPKKVKSK